MCIKFKFVFKWLEFRLVKLPEKYFSLVSQNAPFFRKCAFFGISLFLIDLLRKATTQKDKNNNDAKKNIGRLEHGIEKIPSVTTFERC